MRNYIILNGKSSANIKGLLIQSFAPITKPLLRTLVEEIDGRDGDKTTPLGYSAYDKTITIGLYGDYDVNEVIEFFNSNGTVVFSNEPDKYYNYAIYSQIDFERLIRFRTATVTFHCQPFKYALNEGAKVFDITNNMLTIPNYSKTTNGVTVSVSDGTISISGTATSATEFYVPITSLTLGNGSYTFSATSTGTNPNLSSVRLIGSSPSNADSFANNYVTLASGAVTLQATLTASKRFGYLWFYVNSGTAMDFTVTASLTSSDAETPQSIDISNNGNVYSKPAITLFGTGTVNLSLNGNQLFVINFGDTANYLTIDAALLEAYKDTTNTLMNRYVDGDYDNLRLNVGTNTISWSGTLTQIVIENYSRWL